jgi:hypothetical protein
MYPLSEHLQRPESQPVPFGRDIREDCLSPTVAPVGASSAATAKALVDSRRREAVPRFCSTFAVKSAEGPFPGKESKTRYNSFPNGS